MCRESLLIFVAKLLFRASAVAIAVGTAAWDDIAMCGRLWQITDDMLGTSGRATGRDG